MIHALWGDTRPVHVGGAAVDLCEKIWTYNGLWPNMIGYCRAVSLVPTSGIKPLSSLHSGLAIIGVHLGPQFRYSRSPFSVIVQYFGLTGSVRICEQS